MKFVNALSSLSAVVVLLSACSQQSPPPAANPAAVSPASAPASAASAPAGPPVTVTTLRVAERDMSVNLKANGTVTPLSSVDIRAQLTSTVANIHVKEGQFVRKGELLVTLDARSEEANVAKARAQLAKDEAALADARRQFARAQQLLAQKFISQGALDSSQAQLESQSAVVGASQAALDVARVSLSNTRIVAPGNGRLGAINLSVGSAVQANVTPIVTLTQLDPVAVSFTIPQRNIGNALAALKNGGAPVTVTLADGGGTFTGRLQFVDNAIDISSGGVKVKAVFANPQGKLWPGAFVEVTQTLDVVKGSVVLPQSAIVQGARGTVVYVVEAGKAVLRPVKLVYSEGLDAAVTGIKPGEQIVLDGKQNLRPGSAVQERSKESKDGKAPQPTASKPVAP
jgi:RND family efflux transporter MFP subunit